MLRDQGLKDENTMNDMTAPRNVEAPRDADDFAHLRTLVDKAKNTMFTTLDGEGGLRSRPMHTLQMDDDGALWFVVSASSPKADEVREHEGHVCLAYVNSSDQEYVSISGHAMLVSDHAKKKALWNKMIDIWFPGGDDRDDISLLKVVPERAEFWDGPGNVVTKLYAFTKAMATGKTDAFGENAKLTF